MNLEHSNCSINIRTRGKILFQYMLDVGRSCNLTVPHGIACVASVWNADSPKLRQGGRVLLPINSVVQVPLRFSDCKDTIFLLEKSTQQIKPLWLLAIPWFKGSKMIAQIIYFVWSRLRFSLKISCQLLLFTDFFFLSFKHMEDWNIFLGVIDYSLNSSYPLWMELADFSHLWLQPAYRSHMYYLPTPIAICLYCPWMLHPKFVARFSCCHVLEVTLWLKLTWSGTQPLLWDK